MVGPGRLKKFCKLAALKGVRASVANGFVQASEIVEQNLAGRVY